MKVLYFYAILFFSSYLVSCSTHTSITRNPSADLTRTAPKIRWIPFGAENENMQPVFEHVCKNKQTESAFFYLPKLQGYLSKEDPCFEVFVDDYIELIKLPQKSVTLNDAAEKAINKYLDEQARSLAEAQKRAKKELKINSTQIPQK
jgi:hypothetical protein